MIVPPTLAPLNVNKHRPLQLSATANFACALRDDHSLVCFHPFKDEITTFSNSCPYNINSTYRCGVGRPSDDGTGWIASPFGFTGDNSEAKGFSFIQIQYDTRFSGKYSLLALTYPERLPTLYGSDVRWENKLENNK